MQDAALLAALARCAAEAARADQPRPLFAAIDAAVAATVGHRLFTLLLVDGDEIARLHSSDPTAYPVSGRKRMKDTPWGRHVLIGRQVWIGHTPEDLRWAFPDHATITALGCGACVNVPVVYDDRLLGTINVLHAAGWFDAAKAARIAAFAPLLFLPFARAAGTAAAKPEDLSAA
jgi:GAF domain-containing protein